ncbi:MAG: class I SAM-dependent methyltransferase [Oscillospiraceae bacterium]|nr:class I SAM-dependent methyltransferase [Oscillospiraceae bacterium]
MYGEAFSRIYDEYGWNVYAEVFAGRLLRWLREDRVPVSAAVDLGCGTGVLCHALAEAGIRITGVDLSPSMIAQAQAGGGAVSYTVGDMVAFRPADPCDLVTCTGDALNHLDSLDQVRRLFAGIFSYLAPGGWLVFDLLDAREAEEADFIELFRDDHRCGTFTIAPGEAGSVTLTVTVSENGRILFTETIRETVYSPDDVCDLLRETGFTDIHAAHRLSENDPAEAVTWFVRARKPASDHL